MIEMHSGKAVVWVGSSLQDLKKFPESVRQVMGFAIFQAQCGGRHVDARPLKGFQGSGVLEVVDDFAGNTYRAVYVLHAFQKKSKKGIATPRHDMDIVVARLKVARQIHDARARTWGGT